MSNYTMDIDREKLTIVFTRIFHAPRELVYRAHTDPMLVPKWWSAMGKTVVDVLDVRPGGNWRFVQTDKETGEDYGFRGTFLKVIPNEQLVYTFEFEPMAGHVSEETIDFIDEGGKTKIVDTSKYTSLEDLEGMVSSGMEYGAAATMDALDQLVKEL